MSRPTSISRLCRSCPIHGGPSRLAGRYAAGIRRFGTESIYRNTITQPELEGLIPTAKDLCLWKGDDVTVAMSGGVDSSVVLRILTDFNINIQVVFMRNWDSQLSESSPDGQDPTTSFSYSSDPSSSSRPQLSPCGWQKDWEYVQKVCQHVGIPSNRVHLVDLSREYWTRVFEPAINVWENGGTPNPDVACNREIKFGALMGHIPRHPRSFIATGHYARVKRVPHATRLLRGEDPDKDQTYYMSSISEDQLKRVLTPLGTLKKTDVRKLAKWYGLPTAEREESMGLCFVGERGKFSNFLSQYMTKPSVPGYLVDSTGKRLKEHDGLWTYTIGQNAAIGGMLDRMFVAKKGVGESGQDILVVPGKKHPALMATKASTHDFHWIHSKVPKGIVPGGIKKAWVQVRHRMEPIPCVVSHNWDGTGIEVEFLEPVDGLAIGQVLTLYYWKWCLGSGVIRETWTQDVSPLRTIEQIMSTKGSKFMGDEADEEYEENKELQPRKAHRSQKEEISATYDTEGETEEQDGQEEENEREDSSETEEPLSTESQEGEQEDQVNLRSNKIPMQYLHKSRIEDPSLDDPFLPEFQRLYGLNPSRDIFPWEVVDYRTDKDATRGAHRSREDAGFESGRHVPPLRVNPKMSVRLNDEAVYTGEGFGRKSAARSDPLNRRSSFDAPPHVDDRHSAASMRNDDSRANWLGLESSSTSDYTARGTSSNEPPYGGRREPGASRQNEEPVTNGFGTRRPANLDFSDREAVGNTSSYPDRREWRGTRKQDTRPPVSSGFGLTRSSSPNDSDRQSSRPSWGDRRQGGNSGARSEYAEHSGNSRPFMFDPAPYGSASKTARRPSSSAPFKIGFGLKPRESRD